MGTAENQVKEMADSCKKKLDSVKNFINISGKTNQIGIGFEAYTPVAFRQRSG